MVGMGAPVRDSCWPWALMAQQAESGAGVPWLPLPCPQPISSGVQTTDFPGSKCKGSPPTIKTPMAESLGGWPTCQVAMESGIPHLCLEPQGSHSCHSCSHRDIPTNNKVAFIPPSSWGSAEAGTERVSIRADPLLARDSYSAASSGQLPGRGTGCLQCPRRLWEQETSSAFQLNCSLKRQVSRCGYEFQVLMQASPLTVLCWKVCLAVLGGRR